MIKIISNKKYKKLIEQNERLTKQILRQQNELSIIRNDKVQLVCDNTKLGDDICDLKKQIKNLKSLCTKNNIDYSNLYNKEK